MKTKTFAAFLGLVSFLVLPLSAKEDAPRGFTPLAEMQEALTKSDGKKLVVLVVKGMDDNCPHCTTAMETGLDSVGSGVVKLFARAETIKSVSSANFTPALKDRVGKGFTTGASVMFLVFNPDMSAIIAEASRDELDENKKATAAFKKEVQDARKALK
ncbi:MAG: hypothetical protein V4689_16690 [Verrucomicrobiota bacterium]